MGREVAGQPPKNNPIQSHEEITAPKETAPRAPKVPKGPSISVFGLKDIIHTNQLEEGTDEVETNVSRTQGVINGCPPSPRRIDHWKEDLADAFNQKAAESEFGKEI